MTDHRGECLCGACRYVIKGPKPAALYLCHCSRCRKETGTMHGANVFFNQARLQWEKGQDNITHFLLQGTRKQTAFCKTCDSPLPRREEKDLVVPAGTLDNEMPLEPTAHIHYASRASWEDKLKDLKRFGGLPWED